LIFLKIICEKGGYEQRGENVKFTDGNA